MHKPLLVLALASAALAAPVAAQTSVHIATARNGQLTGSASAGGMTTGVRAGNGHTSASGPAVRRRCVPGETSRSIHVVSPGGSSSTAVSVSGGGTVAVGGGGSRGSRVTEEHCGGRPAVHRPVVHHRVRHRHR